MPPTPIPRRTFLKAAAALPLAGLAGCPGPDDPMWAGEDGEPGAGRLIHGMIFRGGLPPDVARSPLVLFEGCRFERCRDLVVPVGGDWDFALCSFDEESRPRIRPARPSHLVVARCYLTPAGAAPIPIPLFMHVGCRPCPPASVPA